MISSNRMYVDELRRTLKRTAAITAGVAVVSAVIVIQERDRGTLIQQIGYQLIMSSCVGGLFWLTTPPLRRFTDGLRPAARWAIRIAAAALTLNAGISLGLVALALLGVMPWTLYWTVVRQSVVPTTVIGVTCFVGFTMYDTLQYRSQYETAQARLSSLESRLRPHFLFNTLNSILALIPEDPKAAERVTERLAALLRYSLDSSLHNTVRLEQEVKVMKDYLEIEKTRFGDRLQYSIDVPADLMQAQVPPFSLQTLVENSVKYGGGEIRVSARNGMGRLLLRVWDSGDGFPENARLPEGHGLRNLKERLDALWGSNASVEFPREKSGTIVQVSLPTVFK